MNEKNVVITESSGEYMLKNNGISDFALIGILECILFEMKSANRREEIPAVQPQAVLEAIETRTVEISPPDILTTSQREIATPPPDQKSVAADIRVRINKALEAIKGLGGEIEYLDLGNMSDDELQSEFEALTSQYK